MVKKIPTPVLAPESTGDEPVARFLCGTCAYRSPSKTEDLEMTIGYYMECQFAHTCHERRHLRCAGAHAQVSYLEKLVRERIQNDHSDSDAKLQRG